MKYLKAFCCLIMYITTVHAQPNPVYKNLPIGNYAVGFKIITITDDSRVSVPEYNYLGEKNEGERYRKIAIHLWYPAKPNSGNRKITYSEYCYNHLLTSTDEIIPDDRKLNQLNSRRRSVDGWFGKPNDEAWITLLETEMKAQVDCAPQEGKFPLLIGVLRSLSTSITNELLASNGYIVAMVTLPSGPIYQAPFGSAMEIQDMQKAISYIKELGSIDDNNIGTFGFSGSGFSQVLLSMNDYRIKAVADIESGIYMEGLFQRFSASDYYDPSKLQVPFLHLFSRDLSKEEKYINEFENKTKFSERYRVLLNQAGLHHWDFAAEGYTSCVILKNRGEQQANIQKSFEITSAYLLNFFNSTLKSDNNARTFLLSKPVLTQFPSTLWDVKLLLAINPTPNLEELEHIIKTKGISDALKIVNSTLPNDSTATIRQWFQLNNLGSSLLSEQKYNEAIGVFKLNTELHPEDPNLWDSLAEGYESAGDKENMKKASQQVLDLLRKKSSLTDAEKSLKAAAEKRIDVK